MQKITLIIILTALSTFAIAQEKISTYHASNLDRIFNIRAIIGNNNNPILYLEVFSGILHDRYYFKIDNELGDFISALSEAKEKFLDWKKIVKTNNVSYTLKPMGITFPHVAVYWYDSFDKQFTFIERLNLMPAFSATNSKCEFELLALSGLSKDQAYSITLSTDKEFNKLISKISPETLLSKLAKK